MHARLLIFLSLESLLAGCAGKFVPVASDPGPTPRQLAQGWAAVYRLDAWLDERPDPPVDHLAQPVPEVQRPQDRQHWTAQWTQIGRGCRDWKHPSPACAQWRAIGIQWRALQAPADLRSPTSQAGRGA